jgi:alginate O-acetyltransferase complex protein AlgI
MLFNSFEFLLFFPIVTLLYFLLPHRLRWVLLLTASCIFYSFFIWEYIFILIFTIIIDYFAGIWIANSDGIRKKWALVISLAANLGVLGIFKYYYFIIDNINAVSYRLGGENYQALWQFILPIGLSFHTFQAMSYTIEVYRGNQKVEKHFGIYALYVMFYPQLVAGPIERPQNVLYQFYEKHDFNYAQVQSGLRLMLWGFFKKIVIADNLSVYVSKVYNDQLHDFFGFPLIVASVFYSIQIYCDFSGYSDIALGSARVMGFQLMTNFNRPYFSKNISEFWKRWHISLSSWFRDYLYIPLGGNRVSTTRKYLNLFLVFLFSGLWHGASWNFIAWGGIHGFYLFCGGITEKIQNKMYAFINHKKLTDAFQMLLTYCLVTFAWIFFRAKDFADTKYILKKSIGPASHNLSRLVEIIGLQTLVVVGVSTVILFFVENLKAKNNVSAIVEKLPRWQRWGIYYFFAFSIITFGYFGKGQFIYFQF